MLKIAICIEQEQLKNQYISYLEEMKIEANLSAAIKVFNDSKQLLFECEGEEWEADIIFLGTLEIDELQVACELRKRNVDASIVLLLKNGSKAVAAFDVKALRCIDINEMSWEEQSQIIRTAINRAEGQIYQHIVFKNREETCKILLKDIHYFEVFRHTITVYYQRHGEAVGEFAFSGSISKLAMALCEKGFLQPNRSYLVAKSYVKQAVKGKLILENDLEINIGRTKLNEIREKMERSS